MQRIIDITATASLPTPPALTGTTGYFSEGSPGVTPATRVRAWFANMIQEELLALLTAAGITPDATATNFTQVLAAITALTPLGQCRLSVASSTSLLLSPFQGNRLTINGLSYKIPQAGVTLANTGLAANTLYRVYAFINAGVMTLEAVTTAHATDTTANNYGVEIKSGDSSRTLVGMIQTGAGTPGIFQVTTSNLIGCINWFSRRALSLSGASFFGSTTGSGTWVALNTTTGAVTFLSWPDEMVLFTGTGTVSNGTANAGGSISVGIDGVVSSGSSSNSQPATGAQPLTIACALATTLAEGLHTAQLGGQVTGGTGSFAGGLQGIIRG